MPVRDFQEDGEDKQLFMRSDYNDHSKPQRKMVSHANKYLELAMEKLELDESKYHPFLIIADYGSSAGANSSAGVKMIIDKLRQKYGAERSVLVVHNDLPNNNWSGLFNYLSTNKNSYMSTSSGVFACGSGKSFYNQMLPDKSLHFGFATASLHWLSKLPCKLQDHLMSNLAAPKEIDIFRKQAAEDWEEFLAARSKELVKGGVLVLNVTCVPGWGYLAILEAFYVAFRRLYELGIITKEELIEFNLPVFYRALDDITDTEQLRRHGLELVIGEHCTTDSSHFYETIISCEDKLAWASDVVHGIMAIEEPLILQSLSSHRSIDEKKEICSKLIPIYIEEASKIQASQVGNRKGNAFVVIRKV